MDLTGQRQTLMAAGVHRTTFYLRCLEVCDSVSRFMTGEPKPVSAGYKNKLFFDQKKGCGTQELHFLQPLN